MKEKEQNPKLLSPLTLAFIGDGVYELLVREKLVAIGSMSANRLHKLTIQFVSAKAQAQAYDLILGQCSEEEEAMLRRGRNANSTKSRHCELSEYRRATGLETLFGYLYLCGSTERIYQLFEMIFESNRDKISFE